MTDSGVLPRRSFYRILFIIAGFYNILWGLYSALDPGWLFRLAGMPAANYPEIFACMAMVVGLYGLVYWEIARVPERGFALAAVGLLGKILGPIGLALLIYQGRWKPAAAVMCLTNDLLWWVPFGLYLRDSWPAWYREVRP